MAIVTVENNRYAVDFLYQWDINQVLEIRGLSLASVPEIHFSNYIMEKAIVRRATMDDAGVITVDIPNSLLQKPYKITAYVCIYEGDTFKSLYAVEVPVKARTRPSDYTIEDSDEEIYSFNALEAKLENTLKLSIENYNNAVEKYNENAQDYADTVKEINAVKKSVEASALSAESHKNNAKIYQDSAKSYAERARQYAENTKNSDWEENNEALGGYVKNRTHWKEILSSEGTILDTTVSFTTEMMSLSNLGTNNIKADGEYIVYWNGTSYECKGFKQDGSVMLGNGALMSGSSDTGEPFCIELITGTTSTIIKSTSTTESVTLKIEGKESVVYHTLDPRYVEGMYYDENNVTEILPETTVEIPADIDNLTFYTLDMTLSPNETVVVTWNGVEYETVVTEVEEGSGVYALGNFPLLWGGDTTGEPFIIMPNESEQWGFIEMDSSGNLVSGSVTVSIKQDNSIIHKIDNKYLNLDWIPKDELVLLAEEKTVTNNVNVSESEGGFSDLTMDMVYEGMELVVYLDGVSYNCTVYPSEDCFIAGIDGVFDLMILDAKTVIAGISGEHTASVYGYVPNNIPEKYLPKSVDSVIIRSSTPDSTKKFRITVDDTGTIITTEVTE